MPSLTRFIDTDTEDSLMSCTDSEFFSHLLPC